MSAISVEMYVSLHAVIVKLVQPVQNLTLLGNLLCILQYEML
jgi:hypothetical protein